MQKVIKLTDKIPRVDIDHYLASNSEDARVCVLSERDITTIRSYIFPGIEWETRFVRPLGGDNYQTGTPAEFSAYLEALNELDYKLSGGLTMALEDALESIAAAITELANAQSSTELNNIVRVIATSNVCCEQQIINQGGGVIGTATQLVGGNDVPIFGTQQPIDVESGTFPDGYEDLEEYQLDKCQVSNLVVDGVIQTLRNIGAFGVFNGVALAGLIVAAIAGVIIFPPAAIPIMAAAIGFLAVEVTILADVAQEIEDNKEEWVCAIYNSDGVQEAISVLADLIDALLAAIPVTGGPAFWVKQILLLLFNADTLNQAMSKVAHINYPGADCSGCGGGCVGSDPSAWTIDLGELVTMDETSMTIAPELAGGYWYAAVLLSFDEMVVSNMGFSFSADRTDIQYRVQANFYTAAAPYPGTEAYSVTQNQTPPVNINFEIEDQTPVSQVYLWFRPTSTNTEFEWAAWSGMCIS